MTGQPDPGIEHGQPSVVAPIPEVIGADRDAPGAWEALIALMLSEPGMAQRLMGEHATDGTGRCRVCSAGGQTGHYRWPCAIYRYAHEARHRQEAAGHTCDGPHSRGDARCGRAVGA